MIRSLAGESRPKARKLGQQHQSRHMSRGSISHYVRGILIRGLLGFTEGVFTRVHMGAACPLCSKLSVRTPGNWGAVNCAETVPRGCKYPIFKVAGSKNHTIYGF